MYRIPRKERHMDMPCKVWIVIGKSYHLNQVHKFPNSSLQSPGVRFGCLFSLKSHCLTDVCCCMIDNYYVMQVLH